MKEATSRLRGAKTGPYLVEAVVPLASAALVLQGRHKRGWVRLSPVASAPWRAPGRKWLKGTGQAWASAEGATRLRWPGFALPTQVHTDTRFLGSRPCCLLLEYMGLRSVLQGSSAVPSV